MLCCIAHQYNVLGTQNSFFRERTPAVQEVTFLERRGRHLEARTRVTVVDETWGR